MQTLHIPLPLRVSECCPASCPAEFAHRQSSSGLRQVLRPSLPGWEWCISMGTQRGPVPRGTQTSQRWVNMSRHREIPGNGSCRWAEMGARSGRDEEWALGALCPLTESALLQGRHASAGPNAGTPGPGPCPCTAWSQLQAGTTRVTLKTKHWPGGAQPHSAGDGQSVQPCPGRAGSSRREGSRGQHPGAGQHKKEQPEKGEEGGELVGQRSSD